MPGPVLIVELPAEQTLRSEAAALIQACTEGLGGGHCELSSNAESADGVAVVSLRGRYALGALVEVGIRGVESRSWRSQELVFQQQDARIERFRTLGFAIATLYSESRVEPPSRETPPTAEAKRPPPAAAPKPPSLKAKNDKSQATGAADDVNAPKVAGSQQKAAVFPRGWLSAGAITAYDHELTSAFRFGGQVALGVAPLELPLLLNLSGSYAVGEVPGSEASSAIMLSWLTLGVGTGGYLMLVRDLQVRAFVQGAVVRLDAHGTEPDQGQQESQRWLLGGQVGVELVAWASRRWGFALGAQLQQLTGATALTVHERSVATIAALSGQLSASLELRPFQP